MGKKNVTVGVLRAVIVNKDVADTISPKQGRRVERDWIAWCFFSDGYPASRDWSHRRASGSTLTIPTSLE
jgi:hypothetical protein